MKLRVVELSIKVYLYKDVASVESLGTISEAIDTTLAKDARYLEMHNSPGYKFYCFNNFYPMEQDNVYKKGRIYTFKIRSVDLELVKFIKENMSQLRTDSLQVLEIAVKVIPRKHIREVFNITPVVLKRDYGYWRKEHGLATFEDKIVKNLIRRYETFTKKSIDSDIEPFSSISLKNKKPLPTKYKDICLLGDKLKVCVSNDDLAQELLYFALGAGLGEMTARGFGFLNYLWIPKDN